MRGSIAICLATVLFCTGSAWAAYSGGTGEPNSPYLISTVADWQELMATSADWDKNFILTADIDLTGITVTPIGNEWPNDFTGVFDGYGHIIRNTVINLSSSSHVGLFGALDSPGQIKNLGVEDVNITGSYDAGGLVGTSDGSVTSCHATGSVRGGWSAGGLVGWNCTGDVTSCYATCSVSATHEVGGLVGENGGPVTFCNATGSVSGEYNVGGLVGRNYCGSVTFCNATGSVSGTDYSNGIGGLMGSGYATSCYATGSVSGGRSVGGLVGYGFFPVFSCYATGSVSGDSDVGGLAGWSMCADSCYSTGSVSGTGSHVGGLVGFLSGSVVSCYATGSVNGQDTVGGLVGWNHDGQVIKCYSTGRPSGTSSVGGLCGDVYTESRYEDTGNFWDTQTSQIMTSAMGSGKTTAEMKIKGTFTDAGWDFVETWGMAENQTYPFLRTESAADLNNDKKVDFADFAIFAQHWLEGVNP